MSSTNNFAIVLQYWIVIMRDYKRIESDLFTCIIYFSYMWNT